MTDEFRAFCRLRMNADDAQAVAFWRDLASFCYADATTLVPGDPQASAFCEGKRTVFLMLARAAELPLWGKTDAQH